MRLHRFMGDFKLKEGNLKITDKELLNQFRSVLKLKIGERIILCDGNINEGTAEIKGYNKGTVDIEILDIVKNENEPDRAVVLYCAILKKENFELVVQKATEIGVSEMVPLITARTIKLDIRKDRLQKIIKEAAEQSGRGIVPVLHGPVDFEDAVKNVSKDGTNLFFDISGQNLDPHTTYYTLHTTIWTGPEGGWTETELEAAKNVGFNVISLGKTTLRAETAAIIGSYLAIHSF